MQGMSAQRPRGRQRQRSRCFLQAAMQKICALPPGSVGDSVEVDSADGKQTSWIPSPTGHCETRRVCNPSLQSIHESAQATPLTDRVVRARWRAQRIAELLAFPKSWTASVQHGCRLAIRRPSCSAQACFTKMPVLKVLLLNVYLSKRTGLPDSCKIPWFFLVRLHPSKSPPSCSETKTAIVLGTSERCAGHCRGFLSAIEGEG